MLWGRRRPSSVRMRSTKPRSSSGGRLRWRGRSMGPIGAPRRHTRARWPAGRYRVAALRLDQAREAGQGLRETHRTSASRIAEMRRSVALIRAVNAASAEEAEALLGRAEGFLEEGRYRSCEENLKLASLLLADVKGDGPR